MKQGRRQGQAILELVFILPILIILALLIVQYSILMNTAASITNLSREGARFGSLTPRTTDDSIRARVQEVMPSGITIDDDDITISPTQVDDRTSPNLLTVSVSYDMSKKVFLPSRFFGAQIFSETYTSQTTMMIQP